MGELLSRSCLEYTSPASPRRYDYRYRKGPESPDAESGTAPWMALYLTLLQRFGMPATGALLDATADAEVLARLFGAPVEVVRAEVPPPSTTRHIGSAHGQALRQNETHRAPWTRSGAGHRRVPVSAAGPRPRRRGARGRARGADYPQGLRAGQPRALGIAEPRRGHFWGMRGSNRLEDCTILLVVGISVLRPNHMAQLARL